MNEWVGVLSSNTRYYYKFFVVAGGQTYYSAESSFMTLPVKATGVALNKSTATITTGASTTLTASISPSHASNKAVTWSSSNNKIATVTSQGVVKGVTAGTATITATAQDGSGVWARCTVTVRPAAPAAPKNPKAASVGYRKIKVSWAKTAGATGYEVYRATGSGGKYSRVKTITSGNTLSYTNAGLTSGKTYYYKVRAYRTVNGKKEYGVFSSAVSARPIPVKVKSPKAASVGYRKIKVSWAKTAGATGYEVYRATSSGGKYSRVKTITSGNTLSYTNAGLTSGKTYYYKVRAYRAVSGKKVYGVFSNISKARPR
ncbi:MAG: Ig-like domain-containing protein [Christensenellales bacterium]